MKTFNTSRYIVKAWCSNSHYAIALARNMAALRDLHKKMKRGICPDCGGVWIKVQAGRSKK